MAKKGSFYHFLTLFGRFIVLFWGPVLTKVSNFGKTACSETTFFSEKVINPKQRVQLHSLNRGSIWPPKNPLLGPGPLFANLPNWPQSSYNFICLFCHFRDITNNGKVVNGSKCENGILMPEYVEMDIFSTLFSGICRSCIGAYAERSENKSSG